MLKIGKGLKKKKKSKKSKKEDELFKPEELEEYRRQHQAHAEVSADEGETAASSSQPPKGTDLDEWKKFNALTAGVDNILKQTQGDLDRIKQTSFFKRAPPPKPEPPKQPPPLPVVKVPTPPEEVPHFLEEESESEEDEEDIFDTSYVDVVASGEIKLAYVPDSPSDELDFDPFDTSAADKIIRGPEVSKKGKKLVSIGSAVEVLTGRVDSISTSAIPRRSPRRIQGNTDLLLDQVDTNGNPTEEVVVEEPKKSLLDDDESIPIDEPIDLSVSLVQNLVLSRAASPKPQEEEEINLKEFDILANDDLDDEFASLAAESLKTVKPTLDSSQIQSVTVVTESWDAFAGEAKPTSVTEDIREQQGQFNSLKPNHRDLLGGSTTDLSKFASIAPTEVRIEESFDSYSDPFDTSSIDQIKVPGKVELKFIEAELLADTTAGIVKSPSVSDDDFDPRKDEVVVPPEEDPFDTSFIATVAPGKAELKLIESELAELEGVTPAATNQIQHILQNTQNLSKPVVPKELTIQKTEPTDLLFVESEVDAKALTPAIEKQTEIAFSYADPFDTSSTCNILPGKAELKLLENELLQIQSPAVVKPAVESIASVLPTAFSQPAAKPVVQDLLAGLPDEFEHKALTPAVEPSPIEDDYDPFDTSITSSLVPGKVELKLLESELIQ